MNWFSYKFINSLGGKQMNDLKTKTCKELREIAKGCAIKGRWDMTKDELIKAIQDVYSLSDDSITFESDCIIKEEDSTKHRGSQKATKTTIDYLNTVDPGTLVAFTRNSAKNIAMSGKLVSIENGKVKVESKKGTLFKINQENVIWVKTGDRWPRWVFALFNKNSKEVDSDNAIS